MRFFSRKYIFSYLYKLLCKKQIAASYSLSWEQRKAIDIADYSKGNGYSKGDLADAGTPIILYGRLYTKYQFAISEVDTFAVPRNGAVYSQGNEVIVPASGETAEDIARASAVEKSGVLLGGDLNILRPFDFMNPLFLALAISNGEPQKELAKKAQGKSVVHIHNTDIQEVTIAYPSKTEQDRIVSVFRQLDDLITLHQRKYDKLTNVKKSMLEKMFPKNGSNVPEIRFKGFTEAWEQRKLGDNIIEYTETTTKNNQYPPLTSSRKGIFLQTEYFAGNQIASDDNTGYNIVPYGYFTYRHMSDDEIFHFNINDIVENGIVSTLYPVFTTDENLDSRYLQYQLNYGYEFAKFAILQKQGGSRTYMYLNKLKQLYLTMPKSVEEQNAISAFFMSLDNLITLHQRELEKLQNIKKSMLEKMFV